LLDTAPEDDFRKAFGLVAKEANHAWFKSREKGVFLGQLVHQHWEKIVNTPTGQVISQLKRFAHE